MSEKRTIWLIEETGIDPMENCTGPFEGSHVSAGYTKEEVEAAFKKYNEGGCFLDPCEYTITKKYKKRKNKEGATG